MKGYQPDECTPFGQIVGRIGKGGYSGGPCYREQAKREPTECLLPHFRGGA